MCNCIYLIMYVYINKLKIVFCVGRLNLYYCVYKCCLFTSIKTIDNRVLTTNEKLHDLYSFSCNTDAKSLYSNFISIKDPNKK